LPNARIERAVTLEGGTAKVALEKA